MPDTPPARRPAHLRALASLAVVAAVLAGCSPTTGTGSDGGSASTSSGTFFDTGTVHSISIEYDEDDYQAMLDAYSETGDKEWISATVTLDGTVVEDVGLRLKGNSSLRGLGDDAGDSASTDDPASLPWLIRLDKYVDGQEYDGRSDFVVRGNTTESSLNEAVALQVLALADVPAEQATYVRLSVNGGDEELRLVVDLPDDDLWNADAFSTPGVTFKADSDGDYSYRGDDAADYADVFDVKSNTSSLSDDEAYAPLIAFLKFLDEASDAELDAQLGDYLDVDSFAAYLAAQEIVQNDDDIDGPGNNSYLRWDETTGLFTVVAWDQNLSFSTLGGGGGFGGDDGAGPGAGGPGGTADDGTARGPRPDADDAGAPDGTAPTPPDGDAPDGAAPDGAVPGGEMPQAPDGAGGPADGGMGGVGGGMGKENALATRFLASDTFSALYSSTLAELQEQIVASGSAQSALDDLVDTLTTQASDLVDPDVVTQEADDIAAQL